MANHPRYRSTLRPYARQLRRDATFPERLLWSRLRRKQLGVRMLRQQPIAAYIVDFYCPDVGLIIEVDGRSHFGREAEDAARQRTLEALGYAVLRVTNDDVLADLDRVVDRIRTALARLAE